MSDTVLGAAPFGGLYGDWPHSSMTFFKFPVERKVGISQVQVYERVGSICDRISRYVKGVPFLNFKIYDKGVPFLSKCYGGEGGEGLDLGAELPHIKLCSLENSPLFLGCFIIRNQYLFNVQWCP